MPLSINRSLRLLLILPEYPPSFGGMQTHAVNLSRHLAAQGHQLKVLTCRADDPDLHEECLRHDATQSFPVRRVLSRVAHWHSVAQAVAVGRRFAPDLIYASNVYFGEVGRVLGVPTVCRSVGNDVMRPWIAYPFRFGSSLLGSRWVGTRLYRLFRQFNAPEWIERILRDQRRLVMTQAARASACVLANSAFTAALLADLGLPPDSVRVLTGGVDSRHFQPAETTRPALTGRGPRLLTACRLVPKKGLDFLISLMPQIRQRHADAMLDIVGDGRERRRCEAQVARLGLRDCVRFLGRLPQESLPVYYWQADVFVLASRVTRNRISGQRDAETMGRVLCEANAAGVPVLASASGGIPSVIEHERNGLLFAEGDPADCLRQLFRLLDDRALSASLRAAGLQRARDEFDWQWIVRAHEQAFAAHVPAI
ncbi:glycosyltransferase family 4 protein [Uliginosibacterium flavum]|uniref:Glycosyltransferase family 4 protein n=1 Tax=Uliginosibacterium flavum TaxID=1396831 RepID=A0ABV2TNZ4_9RHOO